MWKGLVYSNYAAICASSKWTYMDWSARQRKVFSFSSRQFDINLTWFDLLHMKLDLKLPRVGLC